MKIIVSDCPVYFFVIKHDFLLFIVDGLAGDSVRRLASPCYRRLTREVCGSISIRYIKRAYITWEMFLQFVWQRVL